MDKTIGICGFVGTGSSAVSDFLREFDENYVYDKYEFSIIHTPDGIEDLAYHLNEGSSKIVSSNVAIHRFKRLCKIYMKRMQQMTDNKFKGLTNVYIQKIIQSSWYGCAHADYILYNYLEKSVLLRQAIKFLQKKQIILEKILNRQIEAFPFRQFYFSANPENFYEITKEYIDAILKAAGKPEGKNIVLDQPFSGNDPQKGMRFFNNPRAIIVERDPRDLFLCSKYLFRRAGERLLPDSNVSSFVSLYRNMRKNMPYLNPDPNIMIVNFEDMIYEYQKTTRKIMDFLELKEHSRPMTVFKPELSIFNTQLYQNFPKDEQNIKYIENELSEYLYPFTQYKGVKTKTGKMFDK